MLGEEVESSKPADWKFELKIIQLETLIDRRAVKRCADR